jgi:hypothetical protein
MPISADSLKSSMPAELHASPDNKSIGDGKALLEIVQ